MNASAIPGRPLGGISKSCQSCANANANANE